MTTMKVLAPFFLIALAGCGYDATPPSGGEDDIADAPRAPVEAQAPASDPSRVDSAPGMEAMLVREGGEPGYLADAAGMALYFVDESGAECDEACEQVWPPVVSAQPMPVAGPGVRQPAVASVTLESGGNHVTYRGHRLYRYAGDRGARTVTGDGVRDRWGHWRLMGIDGNAVTPPPGQSGESD